MRSFTGMLELSAVNAATAGGTFDMGNETVVAVHINVTAVGGTPSATFVLEDSADGVNWANVATSSAVTAVGVVVLRSGTTPLGQFVRVRLSAITGTTPTISTTTKGRAVLL